MPQLNCGFECKMDGDSTAIAKCVLSQVSYNIVVFIISTLASISLALSAGVASRENLRSGYW